jgi:chromosome segregation ATPase
MQEAVASLQARLALVEAERTQLTQEVAEVRRAADQLRAACKDKSVLETEDFELAESKIREQELEQQLGKSRIKEQQLEQQLVESRVKEQQLEEQLAESRVREQQLAQQLEEGGEKLAEIEKQLAVKGEEVEALQIRVNQAGVHIIFVLFNGNMLIL